MQNFSYFYRGILVSIGVHGNSHIHGRDFVFYCHFHEKGIQSRICFSAILCAVKRFQALRPTGIQALPSTPDNLNYIYTLIDYKLSQTCLLSVSHNIVLLHCFFLSSHHQCVRHVMDIMLELRKCVDEREKVNIIIIVQLGSTVYLRRLVCITQQKKQFFCLSFLALNPHVNISQCTLKAQFLEQSIITLEQLSPQPHNLNQ